LLSALTTFVITSSTVPSAITSCHTEEGCAHVFFCKSTIQHCLGFCPILTRILTRHDGHNIRHAYALLVVSKACALRHSTCDVPLRHRWWQTGQIA
jgi:hypothetical protein